MMTTDSMPGCAFKELISARALVRPVPTDAYMEAADLVIQSNEFRAADALHLVDCSADWMSELATFDKVLPRPAVNTVLETFRSND